MKKMKWKRALAGTAAFLWVLAFPGMALAAVGPADLASSPYGPGALYAETDYEGVYDLADLLCEEEEAALSEKVLELKERMEMDVAVVTTDENRESIQEYANWFYSDNELGTGKNQDGVLFLIDMDNRELWITTSGIMSRYLPDSRIDAILDDTYSHASEGDYYSTMQVFLEDVEICYENGIAGDQFDEDLETGKISRYHSLEWYEILVALGAASLCGFMAVRSVVRDYGMKDDAERLTANFRLSYRKDSAFTLGNILADVLLGTYVTQTLIAASRSGGNGSSRGSGRGSGRGGGLSGGGRSTIYRTGGRSFGGGGRKF